MSAPPARATSIDWGREDDAAIATQRLLDAAGVVFATKGVTAFRMRDVALAAGCSRGTLYRYFPDRDRLRLAYVERAAARVGRAVLTRLAPGEHAGPRLVSAVLVALDEVRHDPFLLAWFDPATAATAGHVAHRTAVIADLVGAFLDTLTGPAPDGTRLRPGVTRELATEWVVRIVLSLLTEPAGSPDHERALLEQLLVPSLFG